MKSPPKPPPSSLTPVDIPVTAAQAGPDPRLERDPRGIDSRPACQTAVVRPAVKDAVIRQDEAPASPDAGDASSVAAKVRRPVEEKEGGGRRERRVTRSGVRTSSRSPRSRSPREKREQRGSSRRAEGRTDIDARTTRQRISRTDRTAAGGWNGDASDQPPAKRSKPDAPTQAPLNTKNLSVVLPKRQSQPLEEEPSVAKQPDKLSDDLA